MSDLFAMPHASVVESNGRCVFCGLAASDPGPCEKRPRPGFVSVGNETYNSDGGATGTYRDRSSAYPSDHTGFGDCGCDVCCPEPGPSSAARNQVSAAKPENDGGDFKSGASRPFHERFWWLPVATVAAGCLALTGVLVWLAYFGALSRV